MKNKKHTPKVAALKETELIGMEAPQDIMELALWSIYVRNERGISLVFLANPESAKTQLMMKYRENRGVIVIRRFTEYGLVRDLRDRNIKPLFPHLKILGYIVIYDYFAMFTFKANTVDSTTEFVNAFTEDGLSAESAYWISREDLVEFEGLKGGIIAAIAPFAFFTRNGRVRANLCKGGWFSRFIVFSYSISDFMRKEIFDSISRGEYRRDRKFVDKITLSFPKKRVDVAISDKYSQQIQHIALNIAEGYSNRLKPHKLGGFRLHKSLISLVKASALRDGRTKVIQEDVERIRCLSRWMNLEMNPLMLDYPFAGNNRL